MEEKKKENKIIPVILGIIIVLLIGLIVKQVIDFNNNDNSNTNTPNQGNQSDINNSTEKDQSGANVLNKEEEEKLVKRLMSPFDDLAGFFVVGDSKFYGYLYKEKSYTVSDISNETKLYLAIRSLLYDENSDPIYYDLDYYVEEDNGYAKIIIPREDVSKAMKKIFGSNVQYTDVSLNGETCDTGAFKYDPISQTYSQPEPGCGGVGFRYIYTKISSSKINKDNIEIIEEVIKETDDFKIVNISNDSVVDTIDYEQNSNLCRFGTSEGCQSVFDLYPAAISKYKYTFRLENGNYYFEKVELVEDAK